MDHDSRETHGLSHTLIVANTLIYGLRKLQTKAIEDSYDA
jgi:hypothetical protein